MKILKKRDKKIEERRDSGIGQDEYVTLLLERCLPVPDERLLSHAIEYPDTLPRDLVIAFNVARERLSPINNKKTHEMAKVLRAAIEKICKKYIRDRTNNENRGVIKFPSDFLFLHYSIMKNVGNPPYI